MQKYNILELNEKLLPELQTIAEELGIKKVRSFKKEELVYKILDEQAISYAGIQAEKEKVKEAKKAERRGRPKKTSKVENKTAETLTVDELLAQPTEIKLDAPVEEKEPDANKPESKKKKARTDKTDKPVVVKEEVVPAVTETEEVKPQVTVEKNKPLLPPVVMETSDNSPEEVVKAEPQEISAPAETPASTTSETPASEAEPKRLVFRHRDAKSVLDQVFLSLLLQRTKTNLLSNNLHPIMNNRMLSRMQIGIKTTDKIITITTIQITIITQMPIIMLNRKNLLSLMVS